MGKCMCASASAGVHVHTSICVICGTLKCVGVCYHVVRKDHGRNFGR